MLDWPPFEEGERPGETFHLLILGLNKPGQLTSLKCVARWMCLCGVLEEMVLGVYGRKNILGSAGVQSWAGLTRAKGLPAINVGLLSHGGTEGLGWESVLIHCGMQGNDLKTVWNCCIEHSGQCKYAFSLPRIIPFPSWKLWEDIFKVCCDVSDFMLTLLLNKWSCYLQEEWYQELGLSLCV